MTSIEFSAGRLLWGNVRDLVNRLKFDGYDVSLWESSGWLSRDFVIKGDERAVKIASQTLTDWDKQLEAARVDS